MPQEKFQCKQRRTKSALKTGQPAQALIPGQETLTRTRLWTQADSPQQLKRAWGGACLPVGRRVRGQGWLLGPGSQRSTLFCGHWWCLRPWSMSHKSIPLIKESVDYELLARGQRDTPQPWAEGVPECPLLRRSLPNAVEAALDQSDTWLWWRAWQPTAPYNWLWPWSVSLRAAAAKGRQSKSCCCTLCNIHEPVTVRVSPLWWSSLLLVH